MKKPFLFLASTLAAASCTVTEQKPNVVVLYIDDLDFEELGYCANNAYTPFIDSLAAQSMQFSNYYVAAPVSTPSRYSSLTGRYASHSSSFAQQEKCDPAFIRWNAKIVKGKDKTVAEYLRPLGYKSGFVGKWHNGQPIGEKKLAKNDEKDPEFNSKMKEIYKTMRAYVHENSGFDYAESIYANNLHAIGLPLPLQQHNMEWVTKGALDFLKQTDADEPFFLWFSTTVPHGPNPIGSLRGDARITAGGLLDAPITDVQPSRESVLARAKEKGIKPQYAGMIWLDDALRVLFNRLEEMNVLDNTLIIFASDNGEKQGKMTCYQAAAHLPAFVYWKGKIKPMTCDELTSNIDILPTVLDFCGERKIAQAAELDGESWKNMLLKNKPLKREAIYTEVVYQRAIITKDWKYIATRFPESVSKNVTPENRKNYSIEGVASKDYYRNDRDYPAYYDDNQLYDLTVDPVEQHNVYDDPANIKEVARMRKIMQSFVAGLPFDFGEFKSKK